VNDEMRAEILSRNSEIWRRNQEIAVRNNQRTDGKQEELEEQESIDFKDLPLEGFFLRCYKYLSTQNQSYPHNKKD
jgi:hypothetical protein